MEAETKEIETLRPNSTITRIETYLGENINTWKFFFKTKFHYNKDWNFGQFDGRRDSFLFKTKFHYNKDWNMP